MLQYLKFAFRDGVLTTSGLTGLIVVHGMLTSYLVLPGG